LILAGERRTNDPYDIGGGKVVEALKKTDEVGRARKKAKGR
jgi:hypothetical protein